jgi:hypothetical protein
VCTQTKTEGNIDMQWDEEHYRPAVLKIAAFYFRHQRIGFPLLIAGAATVFLPTALRERILFRKRDKVTREIAGRIPSSIHFGFPRC